jgi:hypothetical protein
LLITAQIALLGVCLDWIALKVRIKKSRAPKIR